MDIKGLIKAAADKIAAPAPRPPRENRLALLLQYSRARRIKQYSEVEGSRKGQGRPRPTGHGVTMLDGTKYLFWSDGSLRHRHGRIRRDRGTIRMIKHARAEARS